MINYRIIVRHSLETEARCLYHNLWWAHKDFYIKNGWYVLDNSHKIKKTDPVVLFPKLDYSKIKVRYLSRNDFGLCDIDENDNQTLQVIEEKLKDKNFFVPLSSSEISVLQGRIENILEPIIARLSGVFPQIQADKIRVEVIPSRFGSYGAFDRAYIKDKTLVIGIQPRLDLILDVLPELFISSIVYFISSNDSFFDWEDKEGIIDFLVKYVFQSQQSIFTLQVIKKQDPVLLRRSIEFMKSVNLPFLIPLEVDEKKQQNFDFGQRYFS